MIANLNIPAERRLPEHRPDKAVPGSTHGRTARDSSVTQAPPFRDGAPNLFAWPVRVLLAVIAFVGSAVYAGSYALIDATSALAPVACAVGIAAATAWIGFGFLLLTAAQMRPRRYAGIGALHWADACLATMSVGMAVKMIGVGANVIIAAKTGGDVALALVAPLQLSLLVATDVLMGVLFVRFVRRLRMPVKQAAMLWIVALNGIFAAVLAGLIAYGGFAP